MLELDILPALGNLMGTIQETAPSIDALFSGVSINIVKL